MDPLRTEMNEHFDEVKGWFNTMQTDVDGRFDTLNWETAAGFNGVNSRIDIIHDVIRVQTRWFIGTLIAIGGLISPLLIGFEFIH